MSTLIFGGVPQNELLRASFKRELAGEELLTHRGVETVLWDNFWYPLNIPELKCSNLSLQFVD